MSSFRWLLNSSARTVERAADRKRWAAATTLDQVGELTAQWLQGRIRSQPGYDGPVDVDEDDAPGLTGTLVALNRAGVVTDSSQAGFVGFGADGAVWTQHAWVCGYVDRWSPRLMDDLKASVEADDLGFIAWPGAGRSGRARDNVTVTFRAGQEWTQACRASKRDVRLRYGWCNDLLLKEHLLAAWQVTVFDHVPGRNTMWPVLAGWAAGRQVTAGA